MKNIRFFLFSLFVIIQLPAAFAQVKTMHYPTAPFQIENLKQWKKKHRPAIYDFFENEVYGKVPQAKVKVKYEVLEEGEAFGGKALRRQVAIRFHQREDIPPLLVLMYLPKGVKGKIPVFLGMNFKGNHQIHSDPEIIRSEQALLYQKEDGNQRGIASSRWPVEMLIKEGYGIITLYRGDVDPDVDDDFQNGVHPLFHKQGTKPLSNEWGTIATWAWGLCRVMDYIETVKEIDSRRVAVIGHSRLGKTALWAGATDSRFAMVISNDSGCGGAALSARGIGETIAVINKNFPHWFCDNYLKYGNNEELLPINQHGLIALIAPRPIYVASAIEDTWADPEGEYLSALYASPIYELYGKQGLSTIAMPEVRQPDAGGYVAYHIREGKHDITLYDWEQYVKFANRHWKRE